MELFARGPPRRLENNEDAGGKQKQSRGQISDRGNERIEVGKEVVDARIDTERLSNPRPKFGWEQSFVSHSSSSSSSSYEEDMRSRITRDRGVGRLPFQAFLLDICVREFNFRQASQKYYLRFSKLENQDKPDSLTGKNHCLHSGGGKKGHYDQKTCIFLSTNVVAQSLKI